MEPEVLCCNADQLLHEEAQRGDKKQYIESFACSTAAVAERPAPSVILHIAEGLLDSHSLRKDGDNRGRSRRQRRSQEPRLVSCIAVTMIVVLVADSAASVPAMSVLLLRLLRKDGTPGTGCRT